MNQSLYPLLAIETSGDTCSVALYDGENIYQEQDTIPRCHAEHLMGLVKKVREHSHDAYYAGIIISVGPGSFTGIRAGVSSAIGFALARRALGEQCALYSVTSTRALIAAGYDDMPYETALTVAMIPAGQGRFYAEIFQYAPNKPLQSLIEPTLFEDITSLHRFCEVYRKDAPVLLCSSEDIECSGDILWNHYTKIQTQKVEARNLCILAQKEQIKEKDPQPIYLSRHVYKKHLHAVAI